MLVIRFVSIIGKVAVTPPPYKFLNFAGSISVTLEFTHLLSSVLYGIATQIHEDTTTELYKSFSQMKEFITDELPERDYIGECRHVLI